MTRYANIVVLMIEVALKTSHVWKAQTNNHNDD